MSSLKVYLKALCDPTPEQVWTKANFVSVEHEQDGYRKDDHGNLIRFQDYGKRNSEYGWEIDHEVPSSLGGSDWLGNVRPLHWRANVRKSDSLGGLLRSVVKYR